MKYLILLFPFPLLAQIFIPLDIPVSENDTPLKNPWVGGLNAPQWASLDLDGDGLLDLYAFDRNGDVSMAFLRKNNAPGSLDFEFDRPATAHFPEVRYFVLLRDFNADGVPDMFASSFDEFQNGIKVFRGKRRADGRLEFDRMAFPDFDHDVLYHELDGEVVDQVKVFLASDYPAVDDLDGDGDLDILSMKQSGDKVYFYRNISLEKGFTMDTLMFELADDCWGKFGLLPDSEGFTLSPIASDCAFFTEPKKEEMRHLPHGGSTLLTLDANADGDKDFIYGDLAFSTLAFGKNDGTADGAWLTEQDVSYPSENVPVEIPVFPAAFYLDVDADGHRDLIASPNLMDSSPDRETVHFYRNENTDEAPEFHFQTDQFLVEEILDFGTGAAPAIADANADGLLDLVVGNRLEFDGADSPASLALLLNVGTPAEPAFEVVDRNWLNFSDLYPEAEALVPTFGDLDSDGDLDLLTGDEAGYLHFLENISGQNEPMEFAPIELFWKNIDVGRFAAPCIHDLNEDGLPDLLVGEQLGTVTYFPNLGTPTVPDFHPVPEEAPNNHFFGEINTQPIGSVVGLTQPVILDFGLEKQVVTGSFRGWHPRYLVDESKLDGGAFELLNERWGGLRTGRYSRIAFANLNEDDFLEAVVGNDRGGLSIFRSPILADGTVDVVEKIENERLMPLVYPNPTAGKVTLLTPMPVDLSIHDQMGRVVFQRHFTTGIGTFEIWDLPAGTYFVRMKTEKFVRTEPLIFR